MAAGSFTTTPSFLATLLLSLLLIHYSGNIHRASAVRATAGGRPPAASSTSSSSSSSCVHELSRNVIRRCVRSITRTGPTVEEPSGECCDAVRKAKLLPCLCSYITRDMEDLVDVEKVIGVFTSCGKIVRAGTKCASYTVPRV